MWRLLRASATRTGKKHKLDIFPPAIDTFLTPAEGSQVLLDIPNLLDWTRLKHFGQHQTQEACHGRERRQMFCLLTYSKRLKFHFTIKVMKRLIILKSYSFYQHWYSNYFNMKRDIEFFPSKSAPEAPFGAWGALLLWKLMLTFHVSVS